MRVFGSLSLVAAATAAVSVISLPTARQAQTRPIGPREVRYTVTDLGAPPDSVSGPAAMNSAGEIVGSFTPSHGSTGGFLYTKGIFVDLTAKLGPGADLESINAAGDVVGGMRLSHTPKSVQHAFLYSKGKVIDLGTLGGENSLATGINDSGQIVGDSWVAPGLNGPWHAFAYTRGKMKDLGLPKNAAGVHATGVNAAGDVVGFAFVQSPTIPVRMHPVIWSHGRIEAPAGSKGEGYYAQAINSHGMSVGGAGGRSFASEYPGHVYAFSGGKVRDLGAPGGAWVMPRSINAAGQVVGEARRSLSGGDPRGFLYSNGKLYDLNALLAPSRLHWRILAATAINDRGQIACAAVNDETDRQRAVLLTPVAQGRAK